MYIEHIAIWTNKLEELKNFYVTFFNGKSNEKYTNPKKGFESYFITFEGGARLELMSSTSIKYVPVEEDKVRAGYTHVSFALPNKEDIDSFSDRLIKSGVKHLDGPRLTGDGYYEAKFLDPDENVIEIVASRAKFSNEMKQNISEHE